MKDSKIEWTDHTFNPWIGCTKVSPGCANCYAETQDNFRGWTPEGWGKGKPRKRTSPAYWKQPLQWNSEGRSFGICERCGPKIDHTREGRCPSCTRVDLWMPRRPRVFSASLADIFDDEVPIEWLVDFLELIHDTPNLDWLLLTKRPENWYSRVSLIEGEMAESWIDCIDMPERGVVPQNVWIGTTVENQEYADKRIPELLKVPARIRFLSVEPMLGPVQLPPLWRQCWHWESSYQTPEAALAAGGRAWREPQALGNAAWARIDWVISGGESGPKARPMHPDWARSLRDQCQTAGVPFFFKQWGEHAPYWHLGGEPCIAHSFDPDYPRKVANGEVLGGDPLTTSMVRVGKKAAGRLLDGREWNEVPA